METVYYEIANFIKENPNVLDSRIQFKGLLHDYRMDRLHVNLLLIGYDAGIHILMKSSYYKSTSEYLNQKRKIISCYGIKEKYAKWILNTWLIFYGVEVLGNDIPDYLNEFIERDSSGYCEDEEFCEDEIPFGDIEKVKELMQTAKIQLHRANVYFENSEKEKERFQKKINWFEDELEAYKIRANCLAKEVEEKKETIKELNETLSKERAAFSERLRRPTNSVTQFSHVETHLNSVVEYMSQTAHHAGIQLNNICVRMKQKEGKYYVNVNGEILLAEGNSRLSNSCSIKAALYDSDGKIEIESKYFVTSSSFRGFDTFDIGWNGGSLEGWMSVSKIRIFIA